MICALKRPWRPLSMQSMSAAWTFILFKCPFVWFSSCGIKELLFCILLQPEGKCHIHTHTTKALQRFRCYSGIYMIFTTEHTAFSSSLDHFVYCLALSSDETGEWTALKNNNIPCSLIFLKPPRSPSFHVCSASPSAPFTNGPQKSKITGRRLKAAK